MTVCVCVSRGGIKVVQCVPVELLCAHRNCERQDIVFKTGRFQVSASNRCPANHMAATVSVIRRRCGQRKAAYVYAVLSVLSRPATGEHVRPPLKEPQTSLAALIRCCCFQHRKSAFSMQVIQLRSTVVDLCFFATLIMLLLLLLLFGPLLLHEQFDCVLVRSLINDFLWQLSSARAEMLFKRRRTTLTARTSFPTQRVHNF